MPTIFFFAIFILLVADSFRQARIIEAANPISDQVAAGKRVWERHACFDCHTLYDEGARFAPELGKVWLKYDSATDPDAARQALKGWSPPSRQAWRTVTRDRTPICPTRT
jgi:nitric oxide reductase subunit C